MSRLNSAAHSMPLRGPAPKRTMSTKPLRTSESICNLCQHTGKSTDSSCQTMDLNDEYFLKDAIIRFPRLSAKERVTMKLEEPLNEHGTQTDSVQAIDLDAAQLSAQMIDLTLDRRSVMMPTGTYVEEEKRIRKDQKPHRIGEIPKYLIQRKKELAHAQAMANEAPTGHYLLAEEERLEALHLAKDRYDQLINQLNALSITSQTFRTRNKKIEIEKELQSLDNTLKIFSRSKVFVNLTE